MFIKGKPAYMSPEQANGERLDGRSDLFAVGIMLWEMLVGRRLFIGEDTRATLAAVLFGQVPRPRSIRGDVPKDLERVVMKLLERDLAARYPTAEAAIADLLECADAPKTGREAVIRTLAERFPNEVRMRQSAVRARGASVPPPNAQVPEGYAATMPGAPGHAMPSLSAMMSAPTGTLGPAPHRRRLARGLVVGLVTLAVGAITFGVVASVTRTHGPAAAGSGSATVAIGALDAAPPTPIDGSLGAPEIAPQGVIDAAAPAPTPSDAPPAITDAAAPVDAPKKDASAPQPAQAAGRKRGRLEVKPYNTYYTVYLDGTKLGDTPVERDVPVGKHTLRLVNTDKKIDKKLPIVITETAPTLIEN